MSNKNQPKESNKYGSRLREMTAVLRKHGITGGVTRKAPADPGGSGADLY